jgi:hypothetical protein
MSRVGGQRVRSGNRNLSAEGSVVTLEEGRVPTGRPAFRRLFAVDLVMPTTAAIIAVLFVTSCAPAPRSAGTSPATGPSSSPSSDATASPIGQPTPSPVAPSPSPAAPTPTSQPSSASTLSGRAGATAAFYPPRGTSFCSEAQSLFRAMETLRRFLAKLGRGMATGGSSGIPSTARRPASMEASLMTQEARS